MCKQREWPNAQPKDTIMKKTFNAETGLIEFTFEGGLTAVTLDPARLSGETKLTAMHHGLLQKIGDAAAIPKSAENNYTVTEAMRRDAVLAMTEQLIEGWNAPAKSRAPAKSPVIAALAAKAGVDYDTMAAKLANLDIEALMAK